MINKINFAFYILHFALLFSACQSRLPAPILEPEPEPIRVRLLFAGDVMQHLPQVRAAQREGGFDYSEVFEYVLPHFKKADFVVVNLETTLTHSNHYTGYPLFRSPVALADALRDAGVDVAVLANNHCCDGGERGVRTTVEELKRCGIRYTGVFNDSLDRATNNPLWLERGGVRFALLNYTYGTNGMPIPNGVYVNLIDTVRIAEDITLARQGAPDCIIAYLHWGNEYERQESQEQRQLADFLRTQGVNLIVGSHPHVVQPYKADSTHIVLYSLGNFVSNQRKRYTDGGIMAVVDAVKHPDGKMTFALETIPVWVSLPRYRIIPPEVGDTMALPPAYTLFMRDYK